MQRRTSPSLAQLGLAVDAWETTYLHVLDGTDPVFRWISGTGARPVLQALGDDQRSGLRAGVQGTAARGLPGAAARHRAALPADVRRRPQARRGQRERSGLMLIRDARADDLEVLLRLLDEDAIREVSEDLSDLAPYAAALDEILAAPHSDRADRGARRRGGGDRSGHLAAPVDVRRRVGVPGRVGAGLVASPKRRARG